MLFRHDVVFVVGIQGLVLWRDVDFFGGEMGAGEVFEEVGVVAAVQVDVGVVGVFCLLGEVLLEDVGRRLWELLYHFEGMCFWWFVGDCYGRQF